MNSKTLRLLESFGNVTVLYHASGNRPDYLKVFELASLLAAEKPSLIIDFNVFSELQNLSADFLPVKEASPKSVPLPPDAEWLLSHSLTNSESDTNFLHADFSHTRVYSATSFNLFYVGSLFPTTHSSTSESACRTFLSNIKKLQHHFSEIFILINERHFISFQFLFPSCRTFLFFAPNQEAADAILNPIDNSFFTSLSGLPIWLSANAADKKNFSFLPNAYKRYFKETRSFVFNLDYSANASRAIQNVRRIHLLNKNKPEGFKRFFHTFWPFLALICLILPALVPVTIQTIPTILRDTQYERNKLAEIPYFEYTFDGNESLMRISRYAIGRFHALVSTPTMLNHYVAETLNKNKSVGQIPEKGDLLIPTAGTVIRFYPSDTLQNPQTDSIAPAWRFFTQMISDSIAYLTDLYNLEEAPGKRLHKGIDLAGKRGARILAPFASKAYTFEDERGGTIIGLVQKNTVILFMHCDQILYLTGQKVLTGDPIATIGVTGVTTGPHTHIVTGIIDPKGSKKIGNLRYNIIDPLEWYQIFFKKT